jgi:hypothetical protein
LRGTALDDGYAEKSRGKGCRKAPRRDLIIQARLLGLKKITVLLRDSGLTAYLNELT